MPSFGSVERRKVMGEYGRNVRHNKIYLFRIGDLGDVVSDHLSRHFFSCKRRFKRGSILSPLSMDFREMIRSTTPLYFVFTIDGNSYDVRFKVSRKEMILEFTDKTRQSFYECIKIRFHHDEIELNKFYYMLEIDKKYDCPHLAHADFFKILDVVANMNITPRITLDDGSYVDINGFRIYKNVIAMTKQGRSFYNRHGFVSTIEGVDENFRRLPSQPFDGTGTYQETAAELIRRAKTFEGTPEERVQLQQLLSTFDHTVQTETEDGDSYYKTAAPYTFHIEPVNENTFHVIANSSSGRQSRRKRKRKPKRKTNRAA